MNSVKKPILSINRLSVDDCPDNNDSSIVFLNPKRMEELKVEPATFVELKGKRRTSTIAIALANNDLSEEKVMLTKTTRKNIRSRLGDQIHVSAKAEVPYASAVTVCPFSDSIEGITGDIMETYIKPYFNQVIRPIHKGDYFIIRDNNNPIEFKITDTAPGDFVRVTEDTELFYGDPVNRDAEEESLETIGYDDVGGCRKQIKEIREKIELPIRFPKIYKTIGVKPPKGVLMFGPPGTGKTLLAQAIANETGAAFFNISGPAIISGKQGESEANIRSIFEEAEKQAPSIIFIDEIDSIAPKRDKQNNQTDARVVTQLLVCMDGIKKRSKVIVLAATNRKDTLDPALRRTGRFDKELHIGVPDEDGRHEIFQIHTRNMKMRDDVNLRILAQETHGCVGSDIGGICQEAAANLVRDNMGEIDMDDDELDAGLLAKLVVSMDNFMEAVKNANPSSLRETVIETPTIQWEDIGGMEPVKQEIRETILGSIQNRGEYEKFGMPSGRGILLHGPPGCGKTLLAKAIANECKANFISVKGPELLTMWVGESEANVRKRFDMARAAAPCVLFFDEIDAIARQRGESVSDAGVGDRVMNQLLTEMDGMGVKKDVFVIGATNRPTVIDPALRRPGRLDQLIYIPMPDTPAREAIFRSSLRKTPVSKHVMDNLRFLAEHTEKFSGADIAEVCKRAVKYAIRECVEKKSKLIAAARKEILEDREKRKAARAANSIEDDADDDLDMPELSEEAPHSESNKENVKEDSNEKPPEPTEEEDQIPIEEVPIEIEDPVPQVEARHFELAMQNARRSVSDADILKYEQYAQEVNGSGNVEFETGSAFKFPSPSDSNVVEVSIDEHDIDLEDTEDLYD